MLRTTVSKIKHICALAYFVPRLLRGNIRYIPGRFEKLSVSVQRRVDKSTDSNPTEESDYERCQRIIDRAFSPNPPHTHYIPDNTVKHKESFMHMVTPEMPSSPENQCEKCQRIINQIFGEDPKAEDKNRDVVDPVCIPVTELQATTAKENEETLAQKVEIINETPLVEAPAKPKIEGFNITPKVLGNKRKRRISDRISALNFSSDKPTHGRKKSSSRRDSTLDELAKRCLEAPRGQIDERVLKEIEKLGVPPSSTRRGSRRTANHAGIVQPDIMKRPRRPVEKTELDFLSRMEKLRELERLNDNLPPPFELIAVKVNCELNPASSCDTDDNFLCIERIQSYRLTDQIEAQKNIAPDEEDLNSPYNELTNERPPQQLLGHMTAAVMSDETEMMADKTNKLEHLNDRQDRLNETNIDPFQREPGVVIKSNTDEEISFLKLKQMEREKLAIAREKLASTNLLTDLVDPNEISPQMEPSGYLKEYKEIETLRNILQTRNEHLTNKNIRSLQFKENTTDFAMSSSGFMNSEADSIETLKMERINPHYLKEDPNIISKEMSPHTEPGIYIRESSYAESIKDKTEMNAYLRGYSFNQDLLTPHQLFEQLSLISKETEPGSMIDLHEIDYTSPDKPLPRQLLENVGVVGKADPTSQNKETLSENLIHSNKSKQPDEKQVLDHCDGSVRNRDYDFTNLVEMHDTGVKLLENTLLSSSELSRRALTEEESEDPVIAVEMGRIESAANPDQIADHTFLKSTFNREPVQDISGQKTLEQNNEWDILLSKEAKTQNEPNAVAPETLLNPLLDKGTVAHVAAENMNMNISSTTLPKEHPHKPISLSEMLKKVRERNRMELCKEFIELKIQNTQVDPVVGECGKKKPPCPPPAPTCPPPPKPPCPPQKPPCPNPCKPKCPPTCPPEPCGEPKPKCPPPKKSPCDKFKKTKCSCVKIQDALTLLLYLGPQFHIPQKSLLPLIACTLKVNTKTQNSKMEEAVERIFTKLQDLCRIILIASFRGDIDTLESLVVGEEGINYARTYDPWSPIPSWPIPVKDEKRKLVCPKEGCKVMPPKLNAPCRDINPCAHLPRHNKFTVIDLIIRKLGQKVHTEDEI